MARSEDEKNLTNSEDQESVMDKEEAIRWLVQLTRTEVQKCRRGDLLNLFDDLRRWLGVEPNEPLNRDLRRLQQHPEDVQPIIKELGRLLGAVADGTKFTMKYDSGSVVFDATKLGTQWRGISYRDASPRDAVLRVALDDIYEDPQRAKLIRRCQECSKIYFATRKNQKHCGRECANRYNIRAYRTRHAEKLSDRAHERYERRVKPKGEHVKVQVQRRPRIKPHSVNPRDLTGLTAEVNP